MAWIPLVWGLLVSTPAPRHRLPVSPIPSNSLVVVCAFCDGDPMFATGPGFTRIERSRRDVDGGRDVARYVRCRSGRWRLEARAETA
jgi:hypothetical protein